MLISQIGLQNFRLFDNNYFTFSPHITCIVGENAHGKTSLLEAVYCITHGTGYRESQEEQLINWDAENATIQSVFLEKEDNQLFQIYLKKNTPSTEKAYFVNKVKKTHYYYQQFQTKAVLFEPEQIAIITGSPSKRRDYVNSVICLYDPQYKKHLRNYEHALRKRNKILEKHTNTHTLKEELAFWDGYLEENASFITGKRRAYTEYLNTHPDIESKSFSIEYVPNEFSQERLNQYEEKERLVRRTLIGPQKDDFQVTMTKPEEKNVHVYGSRSEQRLALFWLKLNEIWLVEEHTKRKPLLLLDDIFSELDHANKTLVMHIVQDYQTVITTTEEELVSETKGDMSVIRL